MPYSAPSNADRIPEKYRLFVVGALTLTFAAILFREFWTETVYIAGNDIISPEYLRWAWGWQQVLENGRLPLWNPYLFGGNPFVSTFGFCPFYPFAWPFITLPSSLAITCRFVLSLAIGGTGFYVFARTINTSFVRALCIALLYQSGSHAITLAFPGHIHKLEAIAWTPWAMAFAVMMVRDGRWRWAVGAGVAWTLQLLASHTQIFFATAWMVGAYVLLGAIAKGARERSPRVVLRPLLCLMLAVLLCIGLSAIQMLPGLEMARISNRAGGLSWAEASRDALPLEELPEVVLPTFRGDSTEGITFLAKAGDKKASKEIALPYIGQWHGTRPGNGQRLISDYVGVWAALFALLAFLFTRGGKRWFFLAGAVTAGLFSTGAATPLYKIAFHVVPFFSSFRSPGTLQIATHFFLFALAAQGLEGAAQRIEALSPVARRRATAFQLLAVVVAAMLYTAFQYFEMTSPLFGSTDNDTMANCTKILWLHSLSHVTLFFALGCLTLPLILARREIQLPPPPRINPYVPVPEEANPKTAYFHCRRTRWGAILLLTIALCDTSLHTNRFLPKGNTAQFEEHLRKDWVHDAILKYSGETPFPAIVEEGTELDNRPMMRNVRTLFGYHPVVFANYEKLLRVKGYNSPLVGKLFAQNYMARQTSEEVPDGWRVLEERKGRQILVRKSMIPFAQIPRQVIKTWKTWDEASVEEWRGTLGTKVFDPAKETFCEGNYEWSTKEFFTNPAPSILLPKVEVTYSNSDEFRLKINEKALDRLPENSGGLIPCLVAIPAGPGWRVRIERRSEPAFDDRPFGRLMPENDEWIKDWPRRVNGFFLLVPLSLEPGTETIVSYRPASFRIGAWTTLGTILLIVVCWIAFHYLRTTFQRRAVVVGTGIEPSKTPPGKKDNDPFSKRRGLQ